MKCGRFFDCVRHKAERFRSRRQADQDVLAGTDRRQPGCRRPVAAWRRSGGLFGTLGLFGLAAVVAASVYLADVRPAVKDAGRGGSRNMGPYGPW